MRLTQFTDYALRLMMHVASKSGQRITIQEAAAFYGISRFHLMKVANLLAREDLLRPSRGRSGGLSLSRPASEIMIGDIIRVTEPDFAMVGCMSSADCPNTPVCSLPQVLNEALEAFIATANGHSLAELVAPLALASAQQGRGNVGETKACRPVDDPLRLEQQIIKDGEDIPHPKGIADKAEHGTIIAAVPDKGG